ncbi:hypothetical protein [Curtobacterium sp. MCBD17_040]|uniref:hypothetical protein n=1 Tax=Curtobacterium sp. MCBD17_040 TaxID=2175674 RepID=UPI000DA9F362|nr:hypothetical protein [Curtobacterium sp. MCBD17_040]WIB64363.1 hypothetical protein DEI94_03980 [Curtobacterium sp. MCBD17_040]
MNDLNEKSREIRLRNAAKRQGLELQKSRRRDPRAYDFGTYQLIDPATNTIAAYGLQGGFGLTLDEIEATLQEDHVWEHERQFNDVLMEATGSASVHLEGREWAGEVSDRFVTSLPATQHEAMLREAIKQLAWVISWPVEQERRSWEAHRG